MKITFRYTDKEFIHSRRVNNMLGVSRWKVIGLVLLSLTPSFAIAMIWFSSIIRQATLAAAIFMIFMIVLVIARRPKLADEHEHELTLTDDSLSEKTSHSRFQLRWHQFDEFIETENEFRFRRMDRFVILPKRIFDVQQMDELRQFGIQAGSGPPETEPPIELFDEHFAKPDSKQVYEFTYQPDDLRNAFSEQLVLIDPGVESQSPGVQRTKNRLVIVWLFLVALAAFYLLQFPIRLGVASSLASAGQLLLIAAIIGLPFFLLMLVNRIVRARNLKRLPKVPENPTNLIISATGFAVGQSKNVTFTDWRDVDAFYQNRLSFGFKSLNDLIHVIPKRIFNGAFEAQNFIDQAIFFYREKQRSEIVIATAVETGNPYQTPAN